MILLLGAAGYFGQAFARELRGRGQCFIPLSRNVLDYANFELLFDYVRKIKPDFVINADVIFNPLQSDVGDTARMETFRANILLPQTISRVCLMTNTPWGHVSSGCVFAGAKVSENGAMSVEKDLMRAEVLKLFQLQPEKFVGFSELEEPNLSFRSPPCSFTVGTTALAEESLRGMDKTYIWRPGVPFSECDHPDNLLSILQASSRIYDRVTSIVSLQEFVRACLHLHECQAWFGVYNIANRGPVTMRQVISVIQRVLKPSQRFLFSTHADAESLHERGFILNLTKLQQAGLKMRGAEEALEDALRNWRAEVRREWPMAESSDRVSAPI